LVDNIGSSSVDLSIAPPAVPHITSIAVNGTTLSLTATNGNPGSQVVLLGSTNLALPFSQWTPLLTNNFDSGGNLSLSANIVNHAVPRQFYILRMP
jgi:hypothetical protein